MWYKIDKEYIILDIKALPNSSKNIISEIIDDKLKIKIKAPAVENAANNELVKFLSKTFKVPKNDIEFIAGQTSKHKRIKLPLNDKIEEFIKSKEKE
ncbi:MAG: YggU family protein [Epsilonproteobacteria bacterium]|nr:YggU family protein [Campylobacterota bacterium]